MRVEFHQGVPSGCIKWLWDNVGPGNIEPRGDQFGPSWGDAWKFERVAISVPIGDPEPHFVPTITVKDPKLALLFVLRWS
jgi:hypothetical protein